MIDARTSQEKSCLAVIPARSGSRSIPSKNLALLNGKPLIAYTIETALAAEAIDRLVVTTDSPEIAAIASAQGADAPFLRPPDLARDDTPGIDPVIHAVRWLEQHQGYRSQYVMVLQPTSPLRAPHDIESALDLAVRKEAHAVVSVCQVDQHPHWMKKILDDGRLIDFVPTDHPYARRQDLPPVYAINGAIYLALREVLLQKQTFYTDKTYAHVMPPERSLDIDTPWDLYIADLVLKDRIKNGVS